MLVFNINNEISLDIAIVPTIGLKMLTIRIHVSVGLQIVDVSPA